MLGAIYIGLSGMTSYSKGLDVISNNVANLNTPGFKLAVPLFSDALFRNSTGAVAGSPGTASGGAGVNVDTGNLSFRQGELRDTGNPLDAAMDGNGFFVLEREGERLFTRSGQFEFDKDGFLVERGTQARVMVSTESQAVTDFNIEDLRVFPPKATGEVKISGNLARTGTATFDLSNISVVDTAGSRQTLKAHFVRNATDPLRWTVEVTDADGAVLGSGEIQFNADGTPEADFNSISITVRPKDLPELTMVLRFGEAGTFTGVTSLANGSASQLQVQKQDGIELGALTQVSFDDKGKLTLTYANGEKKTPATLLLAQFDGTDQLRPLGDALFAANNSLRPKYGAAQTAGLGRVIGGRLELSNVELTEQFTNLIIIQRGYQASSQMASVANEMLQQLLAMGKP
jgi:flagellar hook protein FlgE